MSNNNSKVSKIIAMSEAIGESSPVSDELGVLRHDRNSVKVYNSSLRNNKNLIGPDVKFTDENKKKVVASKSIIELSDKIGAESNTKSNSYSQDSESEQYVRGKVCTLLDELIDLFSHKNLEYWCPNGALKESAVVIGKVLMKFTKRLKCQ